ncbi:hypothetical protein Q1695_012099 [Nippostrongylus brasiliensis]|nr:hypothetical protein Q1695_012099 [Nippostrongylus brasiliensis]
MAVRQPPVTWAQRESFLYVTIEIDVTIEDLTADSSKLHFKGTSHTEVDFDKWKDEDDSGAEDDMPNFGAPGGFDLNSYMSQMNNGAGEEGGDKNEEAEERSEEKENKG